jgi:hypothetical protein
MKADPRFLGQNAVFWAHVRTLSQKLGYTKKAKRAGAKSPKRVGARRAKRPPAEVNVPTLDEMCEALADLNLETSHIRNSAGEPSEFGSKLLDYFQYRAGVINVRYNNTSWTRERQRNSIRNYGEKGKFSAARSR